MNCGRTWRRSCMGRWRAAWTATGIFLRAGAVIDISAAGTVSMGGGRPPMPPEGKLPDCSGRGGFPAQQLPCWSLIGRVGEQGRIFYVGSGTTLLVPTEGQLFLGVDDDQLDDNSGRWIVSVVKTNQLSIRGTRALWVGFTNGTSPRDRETELRGNCGEFMRVYVPREVGNGFTDLCGYQGGTCERVCDWQGNSFPCSAISQGGNRDGSRIALCRLP